MKLGGKKEYETKTERADRLTKKSIIIIIIIIIKKDWQRKAGRGRLTPYQSEDPSPTLPTYRGKGEKGEIVEDKKGEREERRTLLLKSACSTPSTTGSLRSFHRDTGRRIKVLRYCRVLKRRRAYRCTDVRPKLFLSSAPPHTAQVEHRKEGASGNT